MDFLNMDSNHLLSIFYIVGNAISILICLLLFINNKKRKETRSRYFGSIVSMLILYFVMDGLWSLGYYKLVSFYEILLKITRIGYYTSACFLGYFWFLYNLTITGSPFIQKKKNLRYLYIPVLIGTLISFIVCLFLDPSIKNIFGYLTAFLLLIVPFGFIIVSTVLVILKRTKSKDIAMKRQFKYSIIWPFIILLFSILQLFIPEIPIFCFGASLITISLYLYNQDLLIFTDPLTALNNRNMLNKFINEDLKDDTSYFVLLLDIDKFKSINDNYGHLEGDKSLRYMAKILKDKSHKFGAFVARYGGDEFIIILEALNDEIIDELILSINSDVSNTKKDLGYSYTVSIGCSKVKEINELEKAIELADEKLYDMKRQHHKSIKY